MKYVFFWDIDGTLLTTARAGVIALEQAYEEILGRRITLEDTPTAGLTDWTIQKMILKIQNQPDHDSEVEKVLRAYEGRLAENLGLRNGGVCPGVLPILDALSRRDDALNLLLTGNTPTGAKIKLSHFGLDRFFGAGAFSERERDRNEIAHKAMQLAQALTGEPINLENTFVIGDTPNDIRCGQSIGARTIGVGTGPFKATELAAHGAWKTFEQLPGVEEFFDAVGLEQERIAL